MFRLLALATLLLPVAAAAQVEIEGGPSPQEMVGEAQESLQSMNRGLRRANDVGREARSAGDVVRMTCVNEKVTVIKGIIRIANDAVDSLSEAVAARDMDQATYEYNKVRVSVDRVNSLVVQAINCVGASATQTGDSQTSVDTSRKIKGRQVLNTVSEFGDPRDWGNQEVREGGSGEPGDGDDGSGSGTGGESGGDDAGGDAGGAASGGAEAGSSVTGGGLAAGQGVGQVGGSGGGSSGGGDDNSGGGEIRPPTSAVN
ncbi:MAG TPA: hypothetical protein DEB46_09315 [Myxococcales bacterium]|nr:hypothetical protein [Myxococcales bacterium]HBU48498.1 hypothetical protein [Myxococcales bacterium]